MKYEVNEKIKSMIIDLCDVALKAGGLKNKPGVDYILNWLDSPLDESKDKGEK